MNDDAKIQKLNEALRMERDMLRGRKPFGLPEGIAMPKANDLTTANLLNEFVQNASFETKLRLYKLLTA